MWFSPRFVHEILICPALKHHQNQLCGPLPLTGQVCVSSRDQLCDWRSSVWSSGRKGLEYSLHTIIDNLHLWMFSLVSHCTALIHHLQLTFWFIEAASVMQGSYYIASLWLSHPKQKIARAGLSVRITYYCNVGPLESNGQTRPTS